MTTLPDAALDGDDDAATALALAAAGAAAAVLDAAAGWTTSDGDADALSRATRAPPARSASNATIKPATAAPAAASCFLRTLVPVATDRLVVRVGHARVVLDAVAAALGLVRLHPAPAIAGVVQEDVALAALVVDVGVAALDARARDVRPVRRLVVEVVRRVRVRAGRERARAGDLPGLGDVARAVGAPRSRVRAVGARAVAGAVRRRARVPAAAAPVVAEADAGLRARDRFVGGALSAFRAAAADLGREIGAVTPAGVAGVGDLVPAARAADDADGRAVRHRQDDRVRRRRAGAQVEPVGGGDLGGLADDGGVELHVGGGLLRVGVAVAAGDLAGAAAREQQRQKNG